MAASSAALTKPTFRGRLHEGAFFISLGACLMLVARASGARSLVAVSVYSFGLLFLFGSSAVYHRFHWEPRKRALIKRLDHSAIFILIAGTATPFALISLPPDRGQLLLMLIWATGLLGVIQSLFWIRAPKWVTAVECIGMGWLSFPFLVSLKSSLAVSQLGMRIAGGVVYSLGAIFYAAKRPALWPAHFGYHELFHLCTVIAAAFHFVVVYKLIG